MRTGCRHRSAQRHKHGRQQHHEEVCRRCAAFVVAGERGWKTSVGGRSDSRSVTAPRVVMARRQSEPSHPSNEDFSFGLGDLSIHEFATDPERNIACSAYYSARMWISRLGGRGLEEIGRFLDFGLYILRYTGWAPASASSP
jgi:hypothetical protein